MAELRNVDMQYIIEPALPVRAAMDEEKLAELKQSLAEIGLLQPIILMPSGERYEIEAGHRRFLAARELGWTEIRAVIYQPGEIQHEAAKLHENLFREDITAAEEALFFAELVEKHGYDEERLCKATSRSANYIADRMRLLRGDQNVFTAVMERKIPFAVGRLLNSIEAEPLRRMYLDQAIRSGAPARVVRDWVNHLKVEAIGPVTVQPQDYGNGAGEDGPAHAMECFFCGGWKDTYNLQMVWIHSYCHTQIQAAIKAQERGEGK